MGSKHGICVKKLLHAMEWRKIDKIIKYVNLGVDINFYFDEYNFTVLDFAINEANLFLVNLLIQKKVNINYLQKDGSIPPFHNACRWGSIDIVELLLKGGANVNLIDHEGRSPMHYAIWSGDINKVKMLISYGADVSVSTNVGESCLHCAALLPWRFGYYYKMYDEIYFLLLKILFNLPEPSDISIPVLNRGY